MALRPIGEVAAELGLPASDVMLWGRGAAKIDLHSFPTEKRGRTILVTAMNPTPAGEGKTTVAIGLTQALHRMKEKVVVVLRQPSLAPIFGVKGGGTGGGKSLAEPSITVNLHLTGDAHAVGAAHNQLSAMVDASIFHQNPTNLDARLVTWPRTVDANDRALRKIVLGLGGTVHGVPHEGRFDVTAASEVMAILALARDHKDLLARLSRIVVGFQGGKDGKPVTAGDLNAAGAMGALLCDAIHPNLVQTTEGAPVLVHAGPFGNIAHGCPSVRALALGQKHADYVVVEAGFGADLGAQKYLDLAVPAGAPWPDAVVVIGTVRACRHHGGGPKDQADPAAVRRGAANLLHHAHAMKRRGLPVVVTINRRADDDVAERDALRAEIVSAGFDVVDSDPFGGGGPGCEALAEATRAAAKKGSAGEKHPYDAGMALPAKLTGIVKEASGGEGVVLNKEAKDQLARFEKHGLGGLAPCMARTSASLTDDPTVFNAPKGFTVNVREVRALAGAGFLVAIAGEILTMPGLGAKPAAFAVGLDENGRPVGLV